MADTIRDRATILTNFADNTTGEISPQDLRDFVVSVHGVYGAMYVNAGSTAQTSISTTPAKITGFAADGVSAGTTVSNSNDTITVLTAGKYYVSSQISFQGTAAKTFKVEIYKNTSATGYAMQRMLGAGGDVGSASVCGIIDCAANDTLSLYVSSSDGGTSITPLEMQLICYRVA